MDSEVSLNGVHLSGIADAAKALRASGFGVLAGQVELAREHFAALAQPVAAVAPAMPAKMHLSAEALAALHFTCGGDDETPWLDGTLWVGDLIGDDGTATHGLHVYCDECPEEGSATLAEFPAHPAPQESDTLDAERYRKLVASGGYAPAQRYASGPWGLHMSSGEYAKDELDAAVDSFRVAQQPKGAGQP